MKNTQTPELFLQALHLGGCLSWGWIYSPMIIAQEGGRQTPLPQPCSLHTQYQELHFSS